MVYIALLRGINVGGNNKVPMLELKNVFEKVGMKNVRTYINSGNVIFESELSRDKAMLLLEAVIERTFGFFVKVLVWDKPSMLALAKKLPRTWVNDTTMKCDAMFLWEDIDTSDILQKIPIKPDIDEVRYYPGVLLWRVDRDKVTRSGQMKIAGSHLYQHITIRNCNTLRKIATLLEAT